MESILNVARDIFVRAAEMKRLGMGLHIGSTVIGVLFLCGCQWMFELGTPGGNVEFKELSPDKAIVAYSAVIRHLQQLGFQQTDPMSPMTALPLDGLFGGAPTGNFEDLHLYEKTNPFVITLQIDMSTDRTAITYQFREYKRLDNDRVQLPMHEESSTEGCAIAKALNEYIVAQLGANHLFYDGSPKCTTVMTGTS